MKWRLLCTLLLSTSQTFAEPIWHCSRTALAEKDALFKDDKNQFSIASQSASEGVIGVSLNDLIDVYSGARISISGLPLSACFMTEEEQLTSEALSSLGHETAIIKALSKKSSIVQSNIHQVSNAKQMIACIEKNFPAVGYLDRPIETEAIQPCFK
jgi:hypothetical protein